MEAGDAVARLVRDEGTRVLATLIRVTGSVGLAEDAVQDAVMRALETWPRDGVPDNPRGWLLVTAKRRAVDLFRREAALSLEAQVALALRTLGGLSTAEVARARIPYRVPEAAELPDRLTAAPTRCAPI